MALERGTIIGILAGVVGVIIPLLLIWFGNCCVTDVARMRDRRGEDADEEGGRGGSSTTTTAAAAPPHDSTLMSLRTFAPALRMRFSYPPATRPISTTPHLFAGGPRPKKHRTYKKAAKKTPHKSNVLSATSFQPRQPFQKNRKPPKIGPERAAHPKALPKAPSRDIIHYIPPSNPLRSRLGPGMYYNAKVSPSRRYSTPLDKDVEAEYLYTLMLRKVFGTPIVPTKSVALKYAMVRCMEATGSHSKAASTRLRKGFLAEALGTKITKKKAWVCDKARATAFDWDLHENMRFIRGHLFTGKEVDYYPPEGQIFGAQALEKTNFEEERGKRFRKAMAILQGDNDATTTTPSAEAAAASTTPTSKIAGMAVASDYDSDGGDSDGKIRDDWVLEDSGSDTDFEALMIGEEDGVISTREGWVDEGSGPDTDIEALMTASDEEGEEWEEWEGDEDEDEDKNKTGKNRWKGRWGGDF
ncbi:hypothetical protein B9Z19DRAFT_1111857 [Tuber borchii]|uniref:Uncharacterized protein n=1 Tax=Tuber borchii TaxID=42251 RepID=A0A2T6Z9L1_TUBBO|nr:hypothetical protein B9Z19DRAFT_1111857 [Tuber borchii]